MHVLDLIQSLRVYDNFEMICLNMIDFNNDVNTSETVEPNPLIQLLVGIKKVFKPPRLF